jgi:hypothetical protein
MNDERRRELERVAASRISPGRDVSTAISPVLNISDTKPRPTAGRRFLVRMMFVALSLVLSLAFVEIAGHVLFRNIADDARFYASLEGNVVRSAPILESTREPGTFDAKFGYTLSPNATFHRDGVGRSFIEHTNSLGFRTREIEPRLPGEYRVMLVGDSYFYGAYVSSEETVAEQLEGFRESDQEVKRPLRVYNFAIPGYCSVQELVVAKTYAAQIQPDAIILGFFAANDLIPNALTRINDAGEFVPDAKRIEQFREDLRAELGPWRHSVIARRVFLTNPSGTRLIYRIGRQAWILEQNFDVLLQFESFCQHHGYRFGVVFQHTAESLGSGWRAALYRTDDVHRPLNEFCVRSRIPHVDMRREFLKAGDWEQFIYKGEGHCSPVGVRKTAEAIYQQLIRPVLVPGART